MPGLGASGATQLTTPSDSNTAGLTLASPNRHARAASAVKCSPCTRTTVPPLTGPEYGLTACTATAAPYVKRTPSDVKSTLFIVTSTVTSPALWLGAWQSTVVASGTLTAGTTASAPKRHIAAGASTTKPVPLTSTSVPPTAGPCVGVVRSMRGGA